MRLFNVLICPVILSVSVASSQIDLAPNDAAELSPPIEQKAETFFLFRKKKKKMKTSGKMKRHNKSMGKKFKRKNDDTLRR
jgi:hypothetical protein